MVKYFKLKKWLNHAWRERHDLIRNESSRKEHNTVQWGSNYLLHDDCTGVGSCEEGSDIDFSEDELHLNEMLRSSNEDHDTNDIKQAHEVDAIFSLNTLAYVFNPKLSLTLIKMYLRN